MLISPHGPLLHARHARIPACIRSVGHQALTFDDLPDNTLLDCRRPDKHAEGIQKPLLWQTPGKGEELHLLKTVFCKRRGGSLVLALSPNFDDDGFDVGLLLRSTGSSAVDLALAGAGTTCMTSKPDVAAAQLWKAGMMRPKPA